ncbi:hypothetical protein D3C85_344090 [compost metagenome]
MEVFYVIAAACWSGLGIFLYNAELNRPGRKKEKDAIGRRDLFLCCCVWPFIFILSMLGSLFGFFFDNWIQTLQWSAFIGAILFIFIAKVSLPEHLALSIFYASIVALCAGYSIAALEKKQNEG